MKKTKIILVGVIILLAIGAYGWFHFFGSQEAQNRWARKRITLLEGDYRITYTDMNNVKVWEIKSGKVTAEGEKGYYFFWARNERNKEYYVQVPINRTYIEEIK